MNTPAAPQGNWAWRYGKEALHPDFATQLAAITEMTDRDGKLAKIEGVAAGTPSDQAHLRMEEGAVR